MTQMAGSVSTLPPTITPRHRPNAERPAASVPGRHWAGRVQQSSQPHRLPRHAGLSIRPSAGKGFGASSGAGKEKPSREPSSPPEADPSPGGPSLAVESRQMQVDATQLLTRFLQAEDLEQAVAESVGSLGEDFFVITSTYLEMARKEGAVEVVGQLERVLQTAMLEKEKTLRPEIRLLNQLLRDKTPSERLVRMSKNNEHIVRDGYFFTIINRWMLDLEAAKSPQEKLLTQLRLIRREASEHVGLKV